MKIQIYLLFALFHFVGMSTWIMLEITHVVPPVCTVSQDLFEAAQPLSAPLKKR